MHDPESAAGPCTSRNGFLDSDSVCRVVPPSKMSRQRAQAVTVFFRLEAVSQSASWETTASPCLGDGGRPLPVVPRPVEIAVTIVTGAPLKEVSLLNKVVSSLSLSTLSSKSSIYWVLVIPIFLSNSRMLAIRV